MHVVPQRSLTLCVKGILQTVLILIRNAANLDEYRTLAEMDEFSEKCRRRTDPIRWNKFVTGTRWIINLLLMPI